MNRSGGTLKPGWTRVAFGDVVRLSRERAPDPEAAGFTRYVGLEHIDPGDLTIRRWGRVSDGTTFTNVFRPGQVLFGKRRAYLRKVAVPDFGGVCSGDIYVLESKDDRYYICCLTCCRSSARRMRSLSTLSARPPVRCRRGQTGKPLRRTSSSCRR